MFTESDRGDYVAKKVWSWLLSEKRFEFVPWVLNPDSPDFDQAKLIEQQTRKNLLAQLEAVIVEASNEARRLMPDAPSPSTQGVQN